MESTLSLRKTDYESKVGLFAGYGSDADAWGVKETANVRDSVESGLRRFYHCGYNWSFLKPFVSLTLAEGNTTVQLPDDFGGLEGRIAVSDSSSGAFRAVEFWNPGRIEQLYSESADTTGIPIAASLRPLKGTAANKGQSQELYLFPTADDDYTLRFQYFILPNFLDGTHPYAYGGAEHVEAILESCLAVFEERYDDITGGSHAQAFMRQLEASKQMDARKRAKVIGLNTDTSDGEEKSFVQNMGEVTYNGVSFS